MTLTYVLMADELSLHERHKAISLVSLTWLVGTVVGPIMSGYEFSCRSVEQLLIRFKWLYSECFMGMLFPWISWTLVLTYIAMDLLDQPTVLRRWCCHCHLLLEKYI